MTPEEANRALREKRARGSLARAIQAYARERPDRLAQVAEALFDLAVSGGRGAIDAARVILDRVDGPVSLGVDAFIGQDRTILLRVGADGVPLPGYSHPPAMPEGLGELDDPLALARHVEPEEDEPDHGPSGLPVHAGPRPLPAEDLGLEPDLERAVAETFAATPDPEPGPPAPPDPALVPAPDPTRKPKGWRPSMAEARAMRREALRETGRLPDETE